MKKVPVKIKKLHPNAVIPKYANPGDAGFDFHACIDKPITIYPDCTEIFGTGLAMAIPEGYELQVRGRSGFAFKHSVGITHGVGTVDSGYRGEIKVVLTNHGNVPVTINPGDRIAQGILNEVPVADFEVVNELDETQRGTGGFGSTGK
jgi:dUTP pyrophosphatase